MSTEGTPQSVEEALRGLNNSGEVNIPNYVLATARDFAGQGLDKQRVLHLMQHGGSISREIAEKCRMSLGLPDEPQDDARFDPESDLWKAGDVGHDMVVPQPLDPNEPEPVTREVKPLDAPRIGVLRQQLDQLCEGFGIDLHVQEGFQLSGPATSALYNLLASAKRESLFLLGGLKINISYLGVACSVGSISDTFGLEFLEKGEISSTFFDDLAKKFKPVEAGIPEPVANPPTVEVDLADIKAETPVEVGSPHLAGASMPMPASGPAVPIPAPSPIGGAEAVTSGPEAQLMAFCESHGMKVKEYHEKGKEGEPKLLTPEVASSLLRLLSSLGEESLQLLRGLEITLENSRIFFQMKFSQEGIDLRRVFITRELKAENLDEFVKAVMLVGKAETFEDHLRLSEAYQVISHILRKYSITINLGKGLIISSSQVDTLIEVLEESIDPYSTYSGRATSKILKRLMGLIVSVEAGYVHFKFPLKTGVYYEIKYDWNELRDKKKDIFKLIAEDFEREQAKTPAAGGIVDQTKGGALSVATGSAQAAPAAATPPAAPEAAESEPSGAHARPAPASPAPAPPTADAPGPETPAGVDVSAELSAFCARYNINIHGAIFGGESIEIRNEDKIFLFNLLQSVSEATLILIGVNGLKMVVAYPQDPTATPRVVCTAKTWDGKDLEKVFDLDNTVNATFFDELVAEANDGNAEDLPELDPDEPEQPFDFASLNDKLHLEAVMSDVSNLRPGDTFAIQLMPVPNIPNESFQLVFALSGGEPATETIIPRDRAVWIDQSKGIMQLGIVKSVSPGTYHLWGSYVDPNNVSRTTAWVGPIEFTVNALAPQGEAAAGEPGWESALGARSLGGNWPGRAGPLHAPVAPPRQLSGEEAAEVQRLEGELAHLQGEHRRHELDFETAHKLASAEATALKAARARFERKFPDPAEQRRHRGDFYLYVGDELYSAEPKQRERALYYWLKMYEHNGAGLTIDISYDEDTGGDTSSTVHHVVAALCRNPFGDEKMRDLFDKATDGDNAVSNPYHRLKIFEVAHRFIEVNQQLRGINFDRWENYWLGNDVLTLKPNRRRDLLARFAKATRDLNMNPAVILRSLKQTKVRRDQANQSFIQDVDFVISQISL